MAYTDEIKVGSILKMLPTLDGNLLHKIPCSCDWKLRITAVSYDFLYYEFIDPKCVTHQGDPFSIRVTGITTNGIYYTKSDSFNLKLLSVSIPEKIKSYNERFSSVMKEINDDTK